MIKQISLLLLLLVAVVTETKAENVAVKEAETEQKAGNEKE